MYATFPKSILKLLNMKHIQTRPRNTQVKL